MHRDVTEWVSRHAGSPQRVLEFGARNINGSARECFPGAIEYVGVDPQEGPDVDIVASGATVDAGSAAWDVVVCTEVLEHVDDVTAAGIIANAYRHLRADGRFIMTCAAPGRGPHSAIDENPIRDFEFYRNVDGVLLVSWLEAAGFEQWTVELHGLDIRCVAYRWEV